MSTLGLRRKTQIITGMVLLGLLAVVYAVTRRTLLVRFSELEEEQTRQNLDRVSNAISNELDLLNGSARDDSMWDEAYDFVQHPRPDWGEKNFGNDTYKHLRLNVLVYFNAAAEPVFAREFETVTGQLKTARPEIVSAFSRLLPSPLDPSKQEGTSGILQVSPGCLLVAAWPVVPSIGQAPPKGVLVMARWLSEGELRRLGWTQNLQFDVYPAHDLRPGDQSHLALRHLSGSTPMFVAPLTQEQIAGYTLLKDINGDSSILLRVVMPRRIHQQGKTTLTFLMLATSIVGLVFTLVNVALLDRMILSRLIALRDAVASIGTASDLSSRVPVQGHDELAELGASMNRMLAAFEHSQKGLRTQAQAIEACADGIAILDEEEKFVYMNRAHAAIFGYTSPRELMGKSWKVLYSEEEIARFEQDILPALRLNSRWEGEAVALQTDGRSFPQQVSLAVLAEGGLVCICRDLSDRRKMEDQLRKKQRMESIGTLAGGIAHDFNNLLTVIIGYGQTLLTKVANDPGLRSNVEHIVQSASRAAALTRQLLAFSRKQVLQPRVLDLNAVVRDLEKMLRPLVGDDIVMVTECAPDLGPVKADLSQIEQVIVNLVVNARDAMPNGGRLVLSTANVDHTHVNPNDRDIPPGDYVVLSVSDNGVGMSNEVLSRIFEPFYTTKDVGKGTGLGLSTVYGIVEQSGGFVSVNSKPGKGTEFNVFLPRCEAQAESKSGERAPSWQRKGTETVLLVEDDAAVRELAHDVLRSCGYRVLAVPDPRQLSSVLEQNSETIHILLTDVLMPGMNGREVAREVQRRHPETKTLYMSGYAYQTMLGRGILEAGAQFIQKPFTPSQLSEKVREVVDGLQTRATTAT
jgi:two-component system cell cycle sensor histidine kinase/response regulator CckA